MAKGMSMEEFRQALSSDARVENEKLKTELEELKAKHAKEMKELREEFDQYKKWCKALTNRCHVATKDILCEYCTVEVCEQYKDRQLKLDLMAAYMAKNKMPRNQESYIKAEQYAMKQMKKMKKERMNHNE